ncbi:type VI secretion system Vgr family protein [Caldimonas caldifontis]|uniref:Type VI secretion system tip protein VgrG n=1 Tax=Caldimonas caldifontis TaxID=1452508 RepID=A0A2S5SVE8_9BURK|nr:type VI secretion system Vgr family protein [Caldimonas caldifontis]PPE66713.1 type VI secretion system tip protein VgrG [Caldimonas caldifontis]
MSAVIDAAQVSLRQVFGVLFSQAHRLLRLQCDALDGASRAGLIPQRVVISQAHRLLRLQCDALDGASRAGLIPQRVVIREALSEPFSLEIDALSPSAALPVAAWLGHAVLLQLQCADGSLRPWHGHVLAAEYRGADGGLARYHLTVGPWLSLLGARRDSFVYQGRHALDIIADVLRDHPQARYRVDVRQRLSVRELCCQYRESDQAFIERLLAEEGLSYHFEHHGAQGDEPAHHLMVITDAQAAAADLGPLPFGRGDLRLGDQAREALTALATHHHGGPTAVVLGSWNPHQLAGTTATAHTCHTDVRPHWPALPVYDGAGQQRYEDDVHAQHTATRRAQALHLEQQVFEGRSSVRQLTAGAVFGIREHSALDAQRWRLTEVTHHITNNLGTHRAGGHDLPPPSDEPTATGSYRNHFRAQSAERPWVPPWRPKPTAPGVQTALVTGVDGAPVFTDRDARVKIQFAWQRGQRPLPGGLGHDSPVDAQGHAPGDERASPWVRVAQSVAGPNWGAVFLPRIGTEVLVDFIDGDIDRPLIVGQLYNEADAPPYAAGEDSGVNHPGTVSGWLSHGLSGEGHNTWVIDDATGQLRMRFLCTQAMSELGLGHLIQQAPTGAQRGPWRGSGFELASAGWTSVRAAAGLLLSSTARAAQGESVQGAQMDSAEALAQAKAAHDLGQRLNEAARPQAPEPLHSHDPDAAWQTFLRSLDPHQDGRYTQAVGGQDPRQAQPGSRSLGDPVPRFAEPLMVFDAAASALFSTEASVVGWAGQDQSWVAQDDMQHTAAHTASLVAGGTVSLYAQAQGLQFKAAAGPLSLRAHTDTLSLHADRDATITSTHDEIHVQAQTRIELTSGSSRIERQHHLHLPGHLHRPGGHA